MTSKQSEFSYKNKQKNSYILKAMEEDILLNIKVMLFRNKETNILLRFVSVNKKFRYYSTTEYFCSNYQIFFTTHGQYTIRSDVSIH